MTDKIDLRRRQSNSGDPVDLKDLLNVIQWQRLQDDFSQITGILMRNVDPQGKPLTRINSWPRLCKLIKDSPHSQDFCGGCLPTFLGGKGTVDSNLMYTCRFGACNFLIPLKILNENLVAYAILGPVVLVMRKPKDEYKNIAEELGLDLDVFWDAFLELQVISFNNAQSLAALIRDVGQHIIELSYNNLELKNSILNKINQQDWVHGILSSGKLLKLFDLLLKIAFQVTNADVGSIMVYDEKTKELSIGVSKGLPENVVKNTRVKFGEGISGIVAKEKTPLILDNNVKEIRIKSLLKRPKIHSSMVIPISIKNRLLGVMNIGSEKSRTTQFNDDSVNLVNRLIDLAGIVVSNTP